MVMRALSSYFLSRDIVASNIAGGCTKVFDVKYQDAMLADVKYFSCEGSWYLLELSGRLKCNV